MTKTQERDVCIVTGGRGFYDKSGLFFVLDSLFKEPILLVQGGARGAGHLVLQWAKSRGIDYDTVDADCMEQAKKLGIPVYPWNEL